MSGSVRRGPAWFLCHDQDGSIAAIERQADRIDIQIDGLQRIRYAEVKARLERLGYDTTNFREPPPLFAWEQRCSNHVRPDDDVEAIIAEAKRSKLDRAYDEFVAARSAADVVVDDDPPGTLLYRPDIGHVLGVR